MNTTNFCKKLTFSSPGPAVLRVIHRTSLGELGAASDELGAIKGELGYNAHGSISYSIT
jgi:hypothetical protein